MTDNRMSNALTIVTRALEGLREAEQILAPVEGATAAWDKLRQSRRQAREARNLLEEVMEV